MKYQLYDLGPDQFEDLILHICKILLGTSAQRFTTGKDGGRDVRFVGTAALMPNSAHPWTGTVIAQAKHTKKINASFLDSDFFPSKSSTLGKEVKAISKLYADENLSHYVLFANRKLTGDGNDTISKWLSDKTSIPKQCILLQSLSDIEDYIHAYPQLVDLAEIDHTQSPLIVDPAEIEEVILKLAEIRSLPIDPVEDSSEIRRITYKDKNKSNGLSDAFAAARLKRYVKETIHVERFLADPLNEDLAQKYRDFAEELHERVCIYREQGGRFDEWWLSIEELLVDRDPELRRNKHVLKTVLFFMYWNCDIGTPADA